MSVVHQVNQSCTRSRQSLQVSQNDKWPGRRWFPLLQTSGREITAPPWKIWTPNWHYLKPQSVTALGGAHKRLEPDFSCQWPALVETIVHTRAYSMKAEASTMKVYLAAISASHMEVDDETIRLTALLVASSSEINPQLGIGEALWTS